MPDIVPNLSRIIRRYDLIYTSSNEIVSIDNCSAAIKDTLIKCIPSTKFLDIFSIGPSENNQWIGIVYVPAPREAVLASNEVLNVVVAIGIYPSEKAAFEAYRFASIRFDQFLQPTKDLKTLKVDLKRALLTIADFEKIDLLVKTAYTTIRNYFINILNQQNQPLYAISEHASHDNVVVQNSSSEEFEMISDCIFMDKNVALTQSTSDINTDSKPQENIIEDAVFYNGKIVSIKSLPADNSIFKSSDPSVKFKGVWLVDDGSETGVWNAYLSLSMPSKNNNSNILIIPLELGVKVEQYANLACRFATAVLKKLLGVKIESCEELSSADYYMLGAYEKKRLIAYINNLYIEFKKYEKLFGVELIKQEDTSPKRAKNENNTPKKRLKTC